MAAPIPITLRVADDQARARIYAIRHQVYATELGQHSENEARRLTDPLDGVNTYLVAEIAGEIVGFVSITPPSGAGYSIDKYFCRVELPLRFDEGLYEIRLLTVCSAWRASRAAVVLMYGAWRYVESLGGRVIVCLGRLEMVSMYRGVGLQPLGLRTRCGDVTFELMAGDLSDGSDRLERLAAEIESRVDWKLKSVRIRPDASCYHGGAFFDAIGDEFDHLAMKDEVIAADVLDAWFEPAPAVLDALSAHLPWALGTSPPTGCDGLRRMLARSRGVHTENILPGAGSSDLIFLGLRHWVRPESRVLILDPMYGEYAHVLERVVGCRVDRLTLWPENDYAVDVDELARALGREYDWVVLVNPNSPTGQHVPGRRLERILDAAPQSTRFWIDETYVEYAGPSQSIEQFAAASDNVLVCKSMSKVYALSGVRCGYLCGPAPLIGELRSISPPWAVSLPGQIAACAALRSTAYYRDRWGRTHALREELAMGLRALGWDVLPGCANFLLCRLPAEQPDARALAAACRRHQLFVRDVTNMGRCFDERMVRIAVKDSRTNAAMLAILANVLGLVVGTDRQPPASTRAGDDRPLRRSCETTIAGG